MLILQNLTQLTQIHGKVSVFDFINYDAYCKFKLGILMNISNINIATFDAKQKVEIIIEQHIRNINSIIYS